MSSSLCGLLLQQYRQWTESCDVWRLQARVWRLQWSLHLGHGDVGELIVYNPCVHTYIHTCIIHTGFWFVWDAWGIALLSALNHISYPWDVWGDSTSLCIESHILSVGCLGG